MRCTKCGKISFDYLETCPSCNQDLSEARGLLGGFVQPMDNLCWFHIEDEGESPPAIEKASGHAQGPVNLSEIDVSDLVSKEGGEETAAEPVEIDPESLEQVAEDENFQKALDEIIPGDT